MVSLSPYPASCPLTYLQPRTRKNEDDFHWAVQTASEKKKLDCSAAEFLTVDEGLCVQMMHHGSYDNEPATIAAMDAYLVHNGYKNDIGGGRLHHEIYLSDPRKCVPEKWKTVIRHPIKRVWQNIRKGLRNF